MDKTYSSYYIKDSARHHAYKNVSVADLCDADFRYKNPEVAKAAEEITLEMVQKEEKA